MFAREKPSKAARSDCRQPRAFSGLVLQLSTRKTRMVLKTKRAKIVNPKSAILVGSFHIHSRSRPRERKAATDAVAGPVVSKTARKLYRVRVLSSYTRQCID